VVGLHLNTRLPTGDIAVSAGPIMASCDSFALTILGRGGHGGELVDTIDPVFVSAAVITALQGIVSREIDPRSSAVVTVGEIHGGTAPNIIPDTVTMRGTVRTYREPEREQILRRILEIGQAVSSAFGGSAEFTLGPGCPPVVNDARIVSRITPALAASIRRPVLLQEPSLGADDMACYLRERPGCYFVVGASDANGPRLEGHQAAYDFDEGALVIGIEALARSISELTVVPQT
jgi:amidohydrolase